MPSKRARARAELYARAAGLTVARIVSIAESGENDGGAAARADDVCARRKADRRRPQIAAGRKAT